MMFLKNGIRKFNLLEMLERAGDTKIEHYGWMGQKQSSLTIVLNKTEKQDGEPLIKS